MMQVLQKRQDRFRDFAATDSQMGEDFVQNEYGINAGNAQRDGARLFELVNFAKKGELVFA